MHIPDGYLSPQTYAPLWVVMGGWWAVAFRHLRTRLSQARLPLIAIGAAFSFVVMMFNIPIPGGTTGHAVGSGLLAILLGPVAASVAISVALVVQALLFGDGGITAIAANCLAMAVVGPWVAWLGYRLAAGRSDVRSWRRVFAGGVGAYLGLNASALVTAVLFGIQPAIAHTATGQPLYAPYPLWVAVPAMMIEHLLLFGVAEAAVTAAAVVWLQRADVTLLSGSVMRRPKLDTPAAGEAHKPRYRILWIALAVMALLTPLGLWLPSLFGAGPAWGEWSGAQLTRMLGYAPAGLARIQSLWKAALPDYTVPGLGGPAGTALGYLIAAVLGAALVACVGAAVAWVARRPAGGASSRVARGGALTQSTQAAFVSHSSPLPAPQPARGRGRADYVGRTLASVGSEVREAMATERSAGAPGWLQGIDARAKIVAALALVLAASLARTHVTLAALYLVTLAVALSSRVPLGTTLKRVWLFVPLFSGLALLPAILNVVTPGEPLLVVARLGPGASFGPWPLPAVITVTQQGVAGAALTLLRVAASVGVTVTLIATTRWQDLLAGLRSLRVPGGFVMITEMAYRYFFLLAGLARDDFLARRSRTIAEPGSLGARDFVAGRATGLFRRSTALAERVHAAMLSRGWTGSPRPLGRRPIGAPDVALAMSAVALAVAVVAAGVVAL